MKIPLQQIAHHQILDMLFNEKLEFDTVYSETKIAKQLEMSRTPVRDAVQKLEQEGYVDIIPSRGFILHKFSTKEIEEIFETRAAIENYCTFYITKNYKLEKSIALFSILDENLAMQKRILNSSKDISEFLKYDFDFHKEIIHSIDNSVFNDIFNTFVYKYRTLAKLSMLHEGRMTDTLEEHTNILEAMKNGNVKKINSISMIHMDTPRLINLQDATV